MKLSHVIYKTDDLDKSVEDFKSQGFKVDYGSKYNPHNALIYFSKGPYIELVPRAPVSWFTKFILRIIGRSKLVDRFNIWDKSDIGFFEICLENYGNDFSIESEILKKNNEPFFITKSKRLDPDDRLLKWKLLFPINIKLPFMMTYFNIDPKPKNFIHPNGIKSIKEVKYGTDKDLIPIVNKLCDDKILKVVEGRRGLIDINY
jgi:hypothetical protein